MEFTLGGKLNGKASSITWKDGDLSGDEYAVALLTGIAKGAEGEPVGPAAGPYTLTDHLKSPLSTYMLVNQDLFPVDSHDGDEIDMPEEEIDDGPNSEVGRDGNNDDDNGGGVANRLGYGELILNANAGAATCRLPKGGTGGGQFSSCDEGGETAAPTAEGPSLGTKRERAESLARAQQKIVDAPVPSEEAVAKALEEMRRHKEEGARAGGEARGGSAADRRRQRQNLFREWGGEQKGYVVCPWTGLKMHWADPSDAENNPHGYARFERGKIFTKCQGGGYQLSNLIPESFSANRRRNDGRIRDENAENCR